MSIQDYEHPALTADVVLFAIGKGHLDLLLIQRGSPPFQGRWAFPGGFVEVGESPAEAASRELKEEAGIEDLELEQLHTFGAPGRDPRGHVVSVIYVGVVATRAAPGLTAGSDASQASWWAVGDLPPLAFDHATILDHALQRLQVALNCPAARHGVRFHLPEAISMGEVEEACRVIAARWGR